MPGKKAKSSMKNIRSVVRSELNKKIETKHKTTTALSYATIGSTTGTLVDVTAIAQGVADFERVGNRIDVQKLYVQKIIKVADNSSSPHSTVRVLLVQSRAGTLTTSDMPNLLGPCDLDKMYVIKDQMLNLSANSVNSAGVYFGSPAKRIKFNLRSLPKKTLQYDDANVNARNFPVYLYMFALNSHAQQAGFETVYFKDG